MLLGRPSLVAHITYFFEKQTDKKYNLQQCSLISHHQFLLSYENFDICTASDQQTISRPSTFCTNTTVFLLQVWKLYVLLG